MSRTPIAVVVGLVGFTVYVAIALILADHVLSLHWTIQALYFLVAGFAWVMPARWLMLWSVHQR